MNKRKIQSNPSPFRHFPGKGKNNKGFTLVELIVVITILAILGTIAFISLQGYSSDARDSTRISDISSIKTSLELFNLEAGKYPNPTAGVNITYSGAIVWNQGTIGETVHANLSKLNKIPLDPSTNKEYTYSVINNKNEYEIGGIIEGDTISMNNEKGIMNNVASSLPLGETEGGLEFIGIVANAATTEATAYVTGNYNGLTAKSLSGNTCNMLTVPTIITNDTNINDLEQIINEKRLVYNGYKNLPSSFRTSKFKYDGGFDFSTSKLLAYSDTGSCNNLTNKIDSSARIELIKGLQDAYSGSLIDNKGEIANLVLININTNAPSAEAIKYAANFVNNNLAGSIPLDNINNLNCASGNNNGYSYNDLLHGNTILVTKTGSITNGNQTSSGTLLCSNGSVFLNNELTNITCNSGFSKVGNKCVKYFAKKIGDTRSDRIFGQTIDNNGNIYITGQFLESTNILGQVLTTNINYNDGFVAKINPNGDLVWAKKFGGTGHDEGTAVAVDTDGNVYLTGKFVGTADFFGQSMTTYGGGGSDLFIAKLDSDGNLIWVQKGGSNSSSTGETGKAIKISDDGYIYFAGEFGGTSAWATLFGTSYNPGGYTCSFIAKLDSDGNIIWLKQTTGGLSEYINDLALDNDGNLYAIGTFAQTANIFGFSLTGNSSATDIYVSKLNPTSGSGVWSKRAGGSTGYDTGESITTDNDGNIYITGGYQLNADFMGVNLTNAGSYYNSYVVKLNSSGTAIWGKQSVSGQSESGKSVKVDDNGNVFIFGEYYDPVTVFGHSLTTFGSNDIFLIKLDSNGNLTWGKRAGGTGGENAIGLNIDSDGNLYVGGNFLSSWFNLFGIGFARSSSSYDIFLGKMSNDGTY
ncbi:MAG: SBBP repeat-containing protein [Candidatus Gracilibacteria bacterium]|nr:SBBP repeat-containing protein [Candidatus Gracilibacteria bacterium]